MAEEQLGKVCNKCRRWRSYSDYHIDRSKRDGRKAQCVDCRSTSHDRRGRRPKKLTFVIPFWNGHDTIDRLIDSLPTDLPAVIVDDCSDEPLQMSRPGVDVIRLDERGYFSGAVNAGVAHCNTDVLILNQDAVLHGTEWLDLILNKSNKRYAAIGDGVMANRAWPRGYIQGTFMFIRRKVWQDIGEFNTQDYPLWGCTCEWQLRACRKGYSVLPLSPIPGLEHATRRQDPYGTAIMGAIAEEPGKRRLFIRTPPMISVIVPCYNYGHYLTDAVNSLVGGVTSLGDAPGQSNQSFEIVIVDDASTDTSWSAIEGLVDRWQGIRGYRLLENRGTAAVLNYGIQRAFGGFIHILSADDMREPHCLETMLRVCQANPHSVAYGDLQVFAHGKRGKTLRMAGYDFDLLLHKNMLPAGIMYPKRAWKEVGGYPASMGRGREDWAFAVALGMHGWCGVHVGVSGNLVRREGHNRSLRTAKEGLVPGLKRAIMALYPEIYRGRRPVNCCGGGRIAGSGSGREPYVPSVVVGAEGMQSLEYTGGNSGATRWEGPVTGAIYIFGDNKRHRVKYVDVRDVSGMLNIRENRHLIFKAVGS